MGKKSPIQNMMSNQTHKVTDALRFTRVKKMLQLSGDVEKLLSNYNLEPNDPLMVFCRMASDVAEDAFVFKKQLDEINYKLYAVSRGVPLTTDTSFSNTDLKENTPPKKVKKPKKVKDPNAPKRPIPAAFVYAKVNKEKVKEMEEHKDKTGREILKVLGKMWKSATEEEKKPFLDTHAQAHKIYKEQLAKYKAETN